MERKGKRGGGPVVLRHGDRLVVALGSKRRGAPPERAKAFSVPYAPVGGAPVRELRATLVARSDESGRITSGLLEIVVEGASVEDAAELAGLSWELLGHRRKGWAGVFQPVSVWTYPLGEAIIACARGGKRQTLRQWAEVARRGWGAQRVYDAVAAARTAEPAVSDGEPFLDVLEREGRVRRVFPVDASHPYAGARARAWTRREERTRDAAGPEARGAAAPTSGRLPFRLLPPGELSVESLKRHYDGGGAGGDPDRRYEPERVKRVLSLGPSACYVGTDEFDGYVVFTFPHTEAALLECPVRGNAAYVIDRDWMELARMSKRELLDERPAVVTKVVHKGDWFERLKLALGS